VLGGRNRSTVDGFGVEMDERERCPREPSVFIHKIFFGCQSASMNDNFIIIREEKKNKIFDCRNSTRSMQGAKSNFYMCH
jgi:hypothetical protein